MGNVINFQDYKDKHPSKKDKAMEQIKRLVSEVQLLRVGLGSRTEAEVMREAQVICKVNNLDISKVASMFA